MAILEHPEEQLAEASPVSVQRRGQWRTLSLWILANICLMVLFVFQYSYFMRDQLANEPMLRPWIEKVCAIAKCTLPLRQELSNIEIVSREVRSHPRAKNALLINATLVNKATFTQAFPRLRLRLSDVTGAVIAQRVFPPRLYLSDTVDLNKGLLPLTPIQLTLEIVDPGRNAVGFEFDLLPVAAKPLNKAE